MAAMACCWVLRANEACRTRFCNVEQPCFRPVVVGVGIGRVDAQCGRIVGNGALVVAELVVAEASVKVGLEVVRVQLEGARIVGDGRHEVTALAMCKAARMEEVGILNDRCRSAAWPLQTNTNDGTVAFTRVPITAALMARILRSDFLRYWSMIPSCPSTAHNRAWVYRRSSSLLALTSHPRLPRSENVSTRIFDMCSQALSGALLATTASRFPTPSAWIFPLLQNTKPL